MLHFSIERGKVRQALSHQFAVSHHLRQIGEQCDEPYDLADCHAYANLRKIMVIYNQSGKKADSQTIKKISEEVHLSEKLVKEMLLSGLQNLSFVDFYKQYADEDAEGSREDVTYDYTFEPCREVIHIEQHDAVFGAFDKLSYRERQVVRAHLGFCEECHTIKGEKNRPQTFYEIAIDHELSSAEAAENIYKKALEKMRENIFLSNNYKKRIYTKNKI